jgi:hypothetical protein
VPLRPLAVGEILDGAFTVVRRHPRAMLGWGAAVMVVSSGPDIAIGLLGGGLAPEFSTTGPAATFGALRGALGGALAAQLLSAAALMVLVGVVSPIVAEAVLGRPATFGTAIPRLRGRVGALLLAAVAAGVLPYLGLLLLIVPGIFLWGALALSMPALVLERVGPGEALRRSWRLATPDWWRVWGLRALATVLASVVGSVLSVPFGIAGFAAVFRTGSPADAGVLFGIGAGIAGLVAAILTQPFVAAVIVLIYLDRRMRAEALDVTLARAASQP